MDEQVIAVEHPHTTPTIAGRPPPVRSTFGRVAVIYVTAVLLGAGIAACAGSGKDAVAEGPSPSAHQPPPPTPETARHGLRDHSCSGVFDGRATGSLTKSTSAGPNESTVSPGQTITVTLTWNPADFGTRSPFKSEDCVQIGSRISAALSQEHLPGPLNGTDTFSYVIPLDGTGGEQICDRAAVRAGDDEAGDGRDTVSSEGGGSGQHDGNVAASVEASGQNSSGGGAGSGDDNGRGDDEGAGQDNDATSEDDHMEKSAVLCYTLLAAAAPEAPTALLFPLAGLLVGGGSLLVVRRRRARRDSTPTLL
jgi:hypothetical protein